MAAKCCDSPVIVTEYGSSVACCTNCGEVVETVFLSNEEPYSDTYIGHSRAGLPLKSFRNDGRVLAGQDTELRRYKLKVRNASYGLGVWLTVIADGTVHVHQTVHC